MKNNFTCFFTHFYVITLLDFTPVWYYKKNYNRQILNAIALLVVIIVFASNIPLFNSIHKEMIYVSIFLIIIDIIFGFTFLRCPHCKKLLNFKWSSQSICHNCGARLDDDVSKS